MESTKAFTLEIFLLAMYIYENMVITTKTKSTCPYPSSYKSLPPSGVSTKMGEEAGPPNVVTACIEQ